MSLCMQCRECSDGGARGHLISNWGTSWCQKSLLKGQSASAETHSPGANRCEAQAVKVLVMHSSNSNSPTMSFLKERGYTGDSYAMDEPSVLGDCGEKAVPSGGKRICKGRESGTVLLITRWVVSNSCDPMNCSRQAPLSMGFPRQEYWSGLPFPSPGDSPDPGIEPKSSSMAGRFFTTEAPGKLKNSVGTEEMKGGQNELASHISKSTQYCFFNLKNFKPYFS